MFMASLASRTIQQSSSHITIPSQYHCLLHTSAVVHKSNDRPQGSERPKQSIKNKNLKSASKDWLRRQQQDPYVRWTVTENFRARSAFKLLQIDDRFQFLKPGQIVVDCGAAPGSWTQVLVKRVNSVGADENQPEGHVLAVDISAVAPINGATILNNCDLMLPTTHDRIELFLQEYGNQDLGRRLGVGQADVIVSDMSPAMSGTHEMDHERSVQLVQCVLYLCVQRGLLRTGGVLLCKLLDGHKTSNLCEFIGKHFAKLDKHKPDSSRSESTELFLLARNFRPTTV